MSAAPAAQVLGTLPGREFPLGATVTGTHITVGPRPIVVLLAASLAPSDARTVVTGRRSR